MSSHQPAAYSPLVCRAAIDQVFTSVCITSPRGRETRLVCRDRSGAAFLLDVEAAVEKKRHHALLAARLRHPQLLAISAAREVKEIAALIVPDLSSSGFASRMLFVL